MTHTLFKWVAKPIPNQDQVAKFCKVFKISQTLATILINRGYDSEHKIKRFMGGDVAYMDNPFLFKDMERAVALLRKHLDNNSPILIWGDRDVDGVTSTVLLYNTLKTLGNTPQWYIPQNEGYGLNLEMIEKYASTVKLVITVDCGVTAYEELRRLQSLGIDVIVTDHHEPPQDIEQFRAETSIPMIDPHLAEYTGFRTLAGVGVVLKLTTALIMSYDEEFMNKDFVVLDVETTGLSSVNNEICEIALARVRNFVMVDTFSTLVKPGDPIPENVTAIHGITNAMVKNSPSIASIMPKVKEFIGDATLVIHNSAFDLGFINTALAKSGMPLLTNPVYDTLKFAREYFREIRHSLGALANEFVFEHLPAHRAMGDVLTTIELFYHMYFIRNAKAKFFMEDNLDLTSLGTIADIMPLIDDNRIIVKRGLEKFAKSRKPACRALMNFLQKRKPVVNAENISWYVTPILNAAGRMKIVESAVELLQSETDMQAQKRFLDLLEINDSRRTLQKTNLEKVYELVEQQCNLETDLILVIVAEGLEHGVTGVVANQLMKEFNHPVVIFIVEGDLARGSARSPKNINMHEVLRRLEHLFVKFGGHANACGITMKRENLEIFRKEIVALAPTLMLSAPEIIIDAAVELEEINEQFINELDVLEPCGAGNPFPVLLLKNVKVSDWKRFGTGSKFTRMTLKSAQGGHSLEAICWDMPDLIDVLKNFNYFNIVGEPEIDPKSKTGIRFIVQDVQPVV